MIELSRAAPEPQQLEQAQLAAALLLRGAMKVQGAVVCYHGGLTSPARLS